MVCVTTFVFFDIETTGLPYQEFNRTKIVELSFVAVTRNDIIRNNDIIPPVSKLCLVFNPQKSIHSAEITSLTNDIVKYSPTFKEKFKTIKSFLEDLKKPVCLVAHNGNSFDYKILLAECADADVRLPEHLLCGDSLPYFRKMFKKKYVELHISRPVPPQSGQIVSDNEITDDEVEWPELNVTSEELQEIDDLCSSLSDVSCESFDNNSEINMPIKNTPKQIIAPKSFKLTDIYKALLGKEPQNAHRAESDCLILLQCVQACQKLLDASGSFLDWIDDHSKLLHEITPLMRK